MFLLNVVISLLMVQNGELLERNYRQVCESSDEQVGESCYNFNSISFAAGRLASQIREGPNPNGDFF